MKKKTTGQKKKTIRPIIAMAVIALIIAAGVYYYNQQQISKADVQWQNVSGPFAINKFQYKIGENIFMVVSNLQPSDAGNITIVDPQGYIYDNIPFNGTLKSSFHSYFKPNTQIALKLCKPTDLVGMWKLAFRGVPYQPLKFNVTNDWINGSQSEIKPIPPDLCK